MKSYLVVGLGNPGLKYRKTRHNMGFMVIDYLSELTDTRVRKSKGKALVGETIFKGCKIVLAKPQTYMNRSGESVRELLSYYKIGYENLIIIYDDMDIELGKIRIREKGSSGSHNGMKSVIYFLKDETFIRIRLGISSRDNGDAIGYVLGKFSRKQRIPAFEGIEKATKAVLEIVENGIAAAMNKYNG